MNSLLMTEFLALNPKVYSINYQSIDEFNEVKVKNKKTLKGVSKTVVKKEISHNDYEEVMNTSKSIKRDVTSIRSFNHQIYTSHTEQGSTDGVLRQDANDRQDQLCTIWLQSIHRNSRNNSRRRT